MPGRPPIHTLDRQREIESKIWELFQKTPEDVTGIAKMANSQLNLYPPLKRTDVYKFLREAASSNRIRYIPRTEDRFADAIKIKFNLTNVRVVDTAVLDDVAYHGAVQLIQSIKQKAKEKEQLQEKDVYIGFSGGYTSKKIVQVLADLLSDPYLAIPATIVFVALVTGFDPVTPGNDPNSFFTYLDVPLLQVKTRFLLIHAAPFIEPSQRERALHLPGVMQAAAAVPQLDIIITSTADAEHEHSMLPLYYSLLEESEPQAAGIMADLKKRYRWCGDCLWLPIGETCGPIDMSQYFFEPFSIVGLADFPRYIGSGKIVTLVVGPCGHPGCPHLKSRILGAVLRNRLVSDLVVDSRTARAILGA